MPNVSFFMPYRLNFNMLFSANDFSIFQITMEDRVIGLRTVAVCHHRYVKMAALAHFGT
jgi:hypothetical protein